MRGLEWLAVMLLDVQLVDDLVEMWAFYLDLLKALLWVSQ